MNEHQAALRYTSILHGCLQETTDVGEAVLAANLAFEMNPDGQIFSPESLGSVDAQFAHDIESPAGQALLDKVKKLTTKLTKEARKRLMDILKLADRREMAVQIVAFVHDYRIRLAQLLGSTQLAALLEGAVEVAGDLPPIPPFPHIVPPPTMPPEEAKRVLTALRGVSQLEKEETIYQYPPDVQRFLRQSLATGERLPPGPPLTVTAPDGDGEILWPVIEEATNTLASKNLVDRPTFDALDAATRQKAFTVAWVESSETLGKIRDALAKNLVEGVDLPTFRKNVLEAVEANTFMSEAHLENVMRTNIQGALSDGQMKVLQHPFIRAGFPYVVVHVIDDDRVRKNHLAVATLGIQGTAIFRIDDPVFQTFRAPWDYQCRCGWTPMTIQAAADAGIEEAKKWLREGIEPSPPAYVPMPDFQPPPGFIRPILAPAVRLSMEPIDFEFPRKPSGSVKPFKVADDHNFMTLHFDGYDQTVRKPCTLIELPDAPQPDTFSCGAMDCKVVAEYFGCKEGKEPHDFWLEKLGTTKENSTDPDRIVEYLNEIGLHANRKDRMTLDDLRLAWSQNQPVLCMVSEYDDSSVKNHDDYGHFLTAIGVDKGYVFVFDSSIDNVLEGEDCAQAKGRSQITEDDWMERWHDRDYTRTGIVVGKKME